MESLRWLKKATVTDPASCEAFYQLALTALQLGQSSGAIAADNALTSLVCIDPSYKKAYYIWRNEIRSPSLENLEKAAECLPPLIDQGPRAEPDMAGHRVGSLFPLRNLQEPRSPGKAGTGCSGIQAQDRYLLKARCMLELGDSLEFERLYNKALDAAEQENDFRRIEEEAELIFTPNETAALNRETTAERKAAFFRVFWRNKDPDPVTPHNERLLAHYTRLRVAEKDYKLLTADGLMQTSPNYLRLMNLKNELAEYPSDIGHALYEYDPVKVWYGRNDKITIDHRGLIYVRHGPPII